GAAPDGVLDVLALACKLGEEELSARGCVFRCLWIEGLELRFRGRRGRNRQRPPGGGLSCVGRKREVESGLGTVTAESHLCGNLSRQRRRDACLEVASVLREDERRPVVLLPPVSGLIGSSDGHRPRLEASGRVAVERACEVIVKIQSEDAGPRI